MNPANYKDPDNYDDAKGWIAFGIFLFVLIVIVLIASCSPAFVRQPTEIVVIWNNNRTEIINCEGFLFDEIGLWTMEKENGEVIYYFHPYNKIQRIEVVK